MAIIPKLLDTLHKVSNFQDTRVKATHPLRLVNLPLFRQLGANAVCVPERPHGQLMQHAQLREDAKFSELVRRLLLSERVIQVRRFGVVLAARVLVEVVEPACVRINSCELERLHTSDRDATRPILADTGQSPITSATTRFSNTHFQDPAPISHVPYNTLPIVLTRRERKKEKKTYINIQILIDLHHPSKEMDILHEIGEFKTIPDPLQHARLLGLVGIRLGGVVDVDGGAGALSRYHFRGGGVASAEANAGADADAGGRWISPTPAR